MNQLLTCHVFVLRVEDFLPRSANPDRDGIINLFEYALNLDPHTADLAPNLPRSDIFGGNLAIVYRKNLAATDMTYTVQGSPDMATWSTVSVTNSTLSDNGQTRIIRATLASPPGVPQYFLRLMVNVVAP